MRRSTASRAVPGAVLGMIVLIGLLGGGWFVLRRVAQGRLQAGIAQFRAGLGPDGAFTYATATAAPWRLGADFTDARIDRAGVVTTAARVALSRVGSDHVGRARLRDVRVDGDGIAASAATVDAADLSLNGEAARGDIQVGRMRAHGIELHASAMPDQSLRITGAALDQQRDGPDGFIEQAVLDGVGFASGGRPTMLADRLIEQARWSLGGRIVADTETTGLRFPPASVLGQQLGQFGYHDAHGRARTGMRYDRQAGTLSVDPLLIRLDGIGALSLSLGLDQMPVLDTRTLRAMLMGQGDVTGLTLRYDDAGLAGHVLSSMAQRAGVTPAQFMAALTANLNASLPNENGQEAIRFLNDPRHFVIALRPPEPLSAGRVAALQGGASQDEIIRALGFSFKAD